MPERVPDEVPASEVPAIETRGLRRTYGRGRRAFHAVRGLDLTVPTGTIHALLGVNGAGKTSALDVLEGLAPASGGEVRVLGMDPLRDRSRVRRRTGVLLQQTAFVADLTVAETVEMWSATVTGARPVAESLALLDLTGRAGVRMRALSGGERRRVDLACALSGRPELLMLDEPTTGLDPESRQAVWGLVRGLRDEGATVLLTTHYLDEAEALADDLSLMRAGEIVRRGTLAEIVADRPSRIAFRTPVEPLPLPRGVSAAVEGELTVLAAPDLQEVLTELLLRARNRGVRLEQLSAQPASLESVFLDLADSSAEASDSAARR